MKQMCWLLFRCHQTNSTGCSILWFVPRGQTGVSKRKDYNNNNNNKNRPRHAALSGRAAAVAAACLPS